MGKKLTHEKIDEKLIKTNIRRAGDYVNATSPMRFMCLICNFVWNTKACNVYNYISGCPKCAGNCKLSNDDIDIKLTPLSIKRIDNYINIDTKINFECLICDYIWKTKPYSVIHDISGCPKCAGNARHNNQTIDEKLFNRTIKRDGEYNSYSKDMWFKCQVCHYRWEALPSNIINNNQGCPQCSNRIPHTNFVIDEKIKNRPIKRIGCVNGIHQPILFECLNCYNIWPASPSSIVHSESGCPICNKAGVSENIINDLLVDCKISFEREFNIKLISPDASNKYRLDFYCPKFKIAIEYNGRQHYMPVTWGKINKEDAANNFIQQQVRDKYVDWFCKNNNINLIWIDGRVYKGEKLKQYIIDYIIPIFQKGNL